MGVLWRIVLGIARAPAWLWRKLVIADARDLYEGMTGSDVMEMQFYLRHAEQPPTIDGIYNGRTKAAVRRFQRENGLCPDGVIDRKTRRALRRREKGMQ